MDWELELVVVPVTDMDWAKHFYGERLGFVVDHDTRVGDEMRVVQLTPPGWLSRASRSAGSSTTRAPTGSTAGVAAGTPSSSSATRREPMGDPGAPRRVACKLHRSSRAWRNRQTRRV
jgi:catechol 2,3-dioxygenase-like lactoylglutathione lyase family enzyme